MPDLKREKAEKLREILIESAAENDETLMEKFFDKDSLTEDEMREGIRKGLLARYMFSVLCTSAAKNRGVRRLMEFLSNNVPQITEMFPYKNMERKEIRTEPTGPTNIACY